MMQNKIAAAVLAGAVVLGLGTGAVASALRGDPDPTGRAAGATPDVEPDGSGEETSGTPDEGGEAGTGFPEDLFTPEEMTIGRGSLGPVDVGMSKEEALATGYFVADVPGVVEGCPALPLAWRDEYVPTFDVQTAGNGEILSMGIFQAGPTTGSGFGVGSTWGELKGWLSDPVEAGFGQTGAFAYDEDTAGFVGFLFDTTVEELTDDEPATFVEVTRGSEPDLMRSGC